MRSSSSTTRTAGACARPWEFILTFKNSGRSAGHRLMLQARTLSKICHPNVRPVESIRRPEVPFSRTNLSYRRVVADGAVAVVREVTEHVHEAGNVAGDDPGEDAITMESLPQVERRVLCIGGRTELDRAASEMIAQLLGERGTGARVHPPIAVSQDAIGQLDLNGIEIACIYYLSPQPQVFARYACRRLKRRARNLKTIVCFLNPPPVEATISELPAQMGADAVAFTLASADEQIAAWLARNPFQSLVPTSEPAIPENEQARLDVLRGLGLTSARGKDLISWQERSPKRSTFPSFSCP